MGKRKKNEDNTIFNTKTGRLKHSHFAIDSKAGPKEIQKAYKELEQVQDDKDLFDKWKHYASLTYEIEKTWFETDIKPLLENVEFQQNSPSSIKTIPHFFY